MSGVDMTPLDRFQAGIWKASFDALDNAGTTMIAWERLTTVNDDLDTYRIPHPRAISADTVGHNYRFKSHMGCPASCRLATLHAYDLATTPGMTSQTHPPSHMCGGTAIAAVSLFYSFWRFRKASNSPTHTGHSFPALNLHAQH
ncbi:hypothetical protein EV363DRAFT_1449408 [Boletus edulis]|nr:hypothetical protein EV363DRAFT_1449408 [Boletus edulis]